MKVINTYEQAAEHKPYCIALGSFDGVHVGHQKLIETLKLNAGKLNCTSMIYTFEVHPRMILKPDRPMHMLTNNAQRAEVLDEMCVDVLYLEDFSRIMNLSAEQFFMDIIIGKFNAKCLVVGYNFKFGKNSEGDAEILTALGDKYGIQVDVVPPVLVDGETVSSSLIRHKIHDGKLDEVIKYLGRPYCIQGKVVHGKQNGKAMGIRTANVETFKEAILPKKGVYISDTKIDNRMYKSVTNVGVNPTFQGASLSIETHVLDFEGDIYSRDIEVYFYKRMRDEIAFGSVNELVSQIKSDIQARMDYKPL